ncbi:MAG TPA: S41 family peptidase [Bacteroidota bacterium]|nr:S41 family peptidase [Bacteroidota bacterium]
MRTALLCGFACCLILASLAFSQDNPLWLRYPSISPDGKTILFEFKGDIYSVPSSGGTAIPLTITEAYEFAPVWSHDGKSIAFASDRYGNFDVFVMPASGGDAKRLTFHSTAEIPSSFTADDRSILFSAQRQPLATNVQFPASLMTQLYSVPVAGGRVTQVLPVPALDATVSSKGDKLIYHDVKGYESPWRKHHTSSVTRDVWVYDFKSKSYRQLTQFNGEDRNPVFDSDDNAFYYLSEQGGSFNIFKSSLSNPATSSQITHFTTNPVRFLTRSGNNVLCFSYDGEIYTMTPGAEPHKVAIRIATDGRSTIDRIVPVNDGFTEAKLSPNGKEFAYIFRGEIFVTSMEGGITKRITNTPWQERSVSFSPDGRSLVYAAEKENNWNVYMVSIARKEEPYFYASTLLKETTVVATDAEEFQPTFSPDGKEVAYLENRVTLKVANLATKNTRTILPAEKNYSYADGDQYYQWSPDGKWFLVQFGYPERIFAPQVGLIAADGKGELHDLTLSGYDNSTPKWVMDGKMMIWGSDREGTRSQAGDLFSGNVYGMFFTKAAFDRFGLSKEEFALVKEQEEKEKKEADEKSNAEKKKSGAAIAKSEKDSVKKDIVIDWTGLTERKLRLTTYTSPASDWLLSKDGEKLFYLTSFDKGSDLWVTEVRTKETKLFAKLGAQNAQMELSADGKFIFLVADGKPMKVDAESGKSEPVRTGGEMVLKQGEERNYIFDHAWRQFKEKFYVPDLQGVDWEKYYGIYKKFLPFINNDYDFAEMLSEMLGEVNASHTGCYYRADKPNSDQTAELGLLYDFGFTGSGVRIAEVVEGGPLDKASSKIRAGNILESIDGQPIDASTDFYQLLNRKTGKLTLLSVYDPSSDKRWDESVKPISGGEENELLYKRWVKARRAEVDKLSNGQIGYVHVRAMNDPSMRTVFEEALGRSIGKKALIVDTRFNGGGGIHEQLSDFLSGKKYFDIIPHGQYVGSEPLDKWTKPSIVLIGESNYSDAHLFPVAYKLKGVGKTLGMPVPGTGTFVWWENQIDPSLRFGIPMGGWRTPDGKFCENNQLEPDIKVQNEPAVMTSGRDQQIEAAVAELLKK